MKPLGSHTITERTNRRQEQEFMTALKRGGFAGLGERQGKSVRGVLGREPTYTVYANTERIFTHLTSSRLCAYRRPLHRRPRACEFADESACLTADNIRNEVVTIHRSQEVFKMLSYLHVDIFSINCFVKKKTGATFLLALTAHQTPTFTGWLRQLCCRSCTRL
jgi:hypothetical protein